MPLITDVVQPVWETLDVEYYSRPDQHKAIAIFPMEGTTGSRAVVTALAHSERDLQLWASLCHVPAARRAAVRRLLNELNVTRRFFKWSMAEDLVTVETDLDLYFDREPEAHFAFLFVLLLELVRELWTPISRAAQGAGPSRIEREVTELLDQLACDDAAAG